MCAQYSERRGIQLVTLHNNAAGDGDQPGPVTLRPGLAGEASLVVSPVETAGELGNDPEIDVLATPSLLLLVESACYAAVKPVLAAGQRLVGAAVQLRHLAPTPVGERVTARATLVEVDGPKLIFEVVVDDEHERVGEARMEQYAIDLARFRQRLARKRGPGGQPSPRS
jgi:predicted thioesterase